jgi:predicted transcriptional regulator
MIDGMNPDLSEWQVSDPPPALGELEREIMDVVWDTGETTVRTVMRAVNAASGRERAYTTVMTVMGNLRRKGVLARRREGRTDFYSPTLTRKDYVEARARSEIGAFVSRYGDLALVHFAREVARLDDERRQRLERLVGDG